ncbi:MAG: Trk system potassium transporter TrkA [Bacteroidales bacterium]|nr:Trk system potassium transporter TrkA [Bacteroidales bacterium]
MNIIIAGDGEVGFYLARSLTALDFNITVVDPHSALLKKLESNADLLTIAGDSTSPEVLKEANVGDCDLFLAVLHDESINLISCMVAKKLKARRTVARVVNAEFLNEKNKEMFKQLGVDEMVCPERIAAKEITNLLNNNVATEFFDFSGGLLTMYLVRLEPESLVVGKSMRELARSYSNFHVRIVSVLRHSQTFIPHSDFVFEPGDFCYIISKSHQQDAIAKMVGKTDVTVRSVAIVGGGRVGRSAAKELGSHMDITLVESDMDRCRDLTTLLDKRTTIINGDATDIDLMTEERIWENDAFVAVTNSTETNVLSCLHARRQGVKRTIALVENTGFINISQDIGIDTIINKKLITASYIARFIVKGDAVSSKWLSGTNAELIEFVVKPHSTATRKPIGELALASDATIGGVIRGIETILPTRETQLQAEDRVVVFALPHVMNKVSKLFN